MTFYLVIPLLIAALCFILVARTRLPAWLKPVVVLVGSFAAISVVVTVLLVGYLFLTRVPTTAELAGKFAERRAALQQIGGMAQADREFSRITRAYVTFAATGKTESSRKAFIADRWRQYRDLFQTAGVRDGLSQDAAGDMFFIAGGDGLIHQGHATGYLFCVDPGSAASARSPYQPCTMAHAESGERKFALKPHVAGYAFRKLAEHWFVFDQGPS